MKLGKYVKSWRFDCGAFSSDFAGQNILRVSA